MKESDAARKVTCARPARPLSAPLPTCEGEGAGAVPARRCAAPAAERGQGGTASRITCSSGSAAPGVRAHLHLHRPESPVPPGRPSAGKGERVHWSKHVTRDGQVSAPGAARPVGCVPPGRATRGARRSAACGSGLVCFVSALLWSFFGVGEGGRLLPPPSPHLEDPHARLRAPRARPCAAATHGARGAAGPAPCPAVPAALGAHESCRPGLVPGGPARGPALCSFPAPPPPGVRPLRGDAPRPRRRNAARAILVGCGRRAGNGAEDGGGR